MAYARAAVDRFASLVDAHRDPDRAAAQAAYMRDLFPFAGLDGAARADLQRQVFRDGPPGPPPDRAALESTARLLWRRREREFQYAGSDLLRRHQRLLEPPSIDLLGDLITARSWWDTVDALAAHPVGGLVRRHPQLVAVMDDWIGSDDLWLARTALLHQLRWGQATDADRLFSYCRARAADTDFFLRKAIGWALRTYARTDPDAVVAFVAANDEALAPLSKREALKHLGGWPPS